MKKVIAIFLLFSSLIFSNQIITVMKPDTEYDRRADYFLAMLELSLEKTKNEYGDYEIKFVKFNMVQSRAIELLSRGKFVDVVWSMTSEKRENLLLPIRIPLIKGLLGHRIFIIRRESIDFFSSIRDVNELKEVYAGQGHDWPDTEILRKNGFKVLTAPVYDSLFNMLAEKRFEYFPRGINEPFKEIENHLDKDLVIEQNLMLKYPAPIFFFVNRENIKLAERIERGLNLAIEDGSFDNLFYNHPITKEMFEKSNIKKRKIFELENPLLTQETQEIMKNKDLWYLYE